MNPFRADESHSRRYLLPVFRAADPALFHDDAAVESLRKFRSLFYDGVAAAVTTWNIPVERVPALLQQWYLLYLAVLMWVALAIIRQLDATVISMLLIGAYLCHERNALVGGDGLFAATFTHREFGVLLGLAAIYFTLQRRYEWAGLALALTVLVHVLVAVHLFLAIAPAVAWRHRYLYRRQLFGLGAFLAACAAYALFLAPPPMDISDARIFLASKGDINHVSFMNQSGIQWLLMIAMICLALLAWRELGKRPEAVGDIEQFLISAACCGVGLSTLFLLTRWVVIAQLQPMRVFTWCTLFVYILLISAASRALAVNRCLAAILAGALGFTMIGSRAGVAFVLLGNAYLIFRAVASHRLLGLKNHILFNRVRLVQISLMVAATVALVVFPPLIYSLLLGAAVLSIALFRQPSAHRTATVALAATIFWTNAIQAAELRRRDADSNWRAVMMWCRDHAGKAEAFLTPPDSADFRYYALRTPVAEVMSALAWTDPMLFRTESDRQARVHAAYAASPCNVGKLLNLSSEWGAAYLIYRGDCDPGIPALFRLDKYSIFRAN